MYVDDPTEDIYQERVTTYSDILTAKFPGMYDWNLHCNMVRALVRREMEYETMDRIVENDFEWTALHLKRRKEAFDAMRACWRALGMSISEMRKLATVLTTSKDGSFADDMTALIVQFQDNYRDPDNTT